MVHLNLHQGHLGKEEDALEDEKGVLGERNVEIDVMRRGTWRRGWEGGGVGRKESRGGGLRLGLTLYVWMYNS